METVTDFILLGSKIAADGVCSHEIERRLLLGRKAMTNLDSILKSRDITLSTKVCLVKAMEEKGIIEDEMVGWHHQLDGHEFEQAPGAGDGQGSMACFSPWGHKESDTTE